MRTFVMLLMLSMGLCPPALGQDTAKWGQVGGWEIRVDRTVGDGCFAMQVFERGTILRIGFDVSAQKIYLLFGHDDWKSIEAGKIYPIRAVFDGISTYNGEMTGQAVGKRVFLVHRNLSTDFVKDFMQRNGMQVFYRGRPDRQLVSQKHLCCGRRGGELSARNRRQPRDKQSRSLCIEPSSTESRPVPLTG